MAILLKELTGKEILLKKVPYIWISVKQLSPRLIAVQLFYTLEWRQKKI